MNCGRACAVLLVACLLLAGCATPSSERARDQPARYEPYSDRPKTAGEYWAAREMEDRIEAVRDGNQSRRP